MMGVGRNTIGIQIICGLLMLMPGIIWAQTAKPLPQAVLINGVEFVYIPAGWFWFPAIEKTMDEELKRLSGRIREVRVWLDDYYIAKYEARARDYLRYLRQNQPKPHKKRESGVLGCLFDPTLVTKQLKIEADLPMYGLGWNNAQHFIHWMGFRMPSEMEWVKAARGVDKRLWPWGDVHPDDTYAHFSAGKGCFPVEVNARPKGQSPFGVHQMAGNVSEFVLDWSNYQYYRDLKDGARNPPPATYLKRDGGKDLGDLGLRRLEKGGGWSQAEHKITVPEQRAAPPDDRRRNGGMRYVVSVGQVRRHLADGTGSVILSEGSNP